MREGRLLPIKVVFKRDLDYVMPEPSGGGPTPLCDVTPQLREELAEQVRGVRDSFAPAFAKWKGLPAVAKVGLKRLAIAKSHRPTDLFSLDTCPIIGGDRLGELYVSVRPGGLDHLIDRIENGQTLQTIANISAL